MNNKISDITKHFYYIYYNLLSSNNEDEFINEFIDLSTEYKLEDFYTIIDIKKLIYHLKTKHKRSFKILILTYKKSNLYAKLTLYHDDNKNGLQTILTIIKKLKEAKLFMNAFSHFAINLQTNEMDECNILSYENKNEMISRLEQLYKYFGLNFYYVFGINKYTYKTLLETTHDDMVVIYNSHIDDIKKIIDRYLELCNIYIQVEKLLFQILISSQSDGEETDNKELDEYSFMIE